MERKIHIQEPFEKVFDFKTYSVRVTHNGIWFMRDNRTLMVPSEFRNRYDEQTGIIVIKNIYLRFNAYFPHEREKMFDCLAYIFNAKNFIDNGA